MAAALLIECRGSTKEHLEENIQARCCGPLHLHYHAAHAAAFGICTTRRFARLPTVCRARVSLLQLYVAPASARLCG